MFWVCGKNPLDEYKDYISHMLFFSFLFFFGFILNWSSFSKKILTS